MEYIIITYSLTIKINIHIKLYLILLKYNDIIKSFWTHLNYKTFFIILEKTKEKTLPMY